MALAGESIDVVLGSSTKFLSKTASLMLLGPPPGLDAVYPIQTTQFDPSGPDAVQLHVSGKSGAQRRKRKLMRKIFWHKGYCTVMKHPQLQCAIVRLSSASFRTALLSKLKDGLPGNAACLDVGGVVATVTTHFDCHFNRDVENELLVHWQESTTCSSPTADIIAEKINKLMLEIVKLADVSEFAPDTSSLPKINLA
eukprot:TRINITY_DN32767_c0_g1_i1.p1 TRINITY_DN32767_c0_g1~~TRINITY_DN32767_c0_g1_i1.p1  ORF type:complete len:220 (+),score=33.91 TRINITY_DN32767_c0_g1_i1:71-661(+)